MSVVRDIVFDAEKFGKRVRDGMFEDRLSCRELAEIAGVGHATISRISKGKRPDADTLIKLLYWLGEDSVEYTKKVKL